MKLKPSRMCKNEALAKFDICKNILLYSTMFSLARNYLKNFPLFDFATDFHLI